MYTTLFSLYLDAMLKICRSLWVPRKNSYRVLVHIQATLHILR
jgi:hypothetical protein